MKKLINSLTVSYYRRSLSYIGSGSTFTHKVEFINPQNISIGNNTYINGGMIIAGKGSKIIIGDNCLISYNVHIRTESHKHDNVRMLIKDQGTFEKDIIIGNNVWIGYGAQILPGISIGDNVIIGAGAIVTKNIPKDCIIGGVPAKLIRKR